MSHLQEIADEQLAAIARTTAYHSSEQHDYMKGSGRTDWLPHKWVVEAMRAAVTIRNNQAEKEIRDELHRVTAERDALQLRLNAVEDENDRLRNNEHLEVAGHEGSSGLYYSRLAAVANGEQSVEPVYRVKK